MRERFTLPTGMWSAQYALLGSHRRALLLTLGYAGLLLTGGFAFWRANPSQPFPWVADWLLRAMAAIQIGIIVLGGCNAVYRAMLRDYETKMLESHRLTPMSNTAVCLGYLFGSTLQTVALFTVTLVGGTIVAFAGDLPIGPVVQGNLLFLAGALPLWAAVMFSGMRMSKPISPAPFLIGFATLSTAIVFLPGLGLLLSVYSIGLGFSSIGGVGPTPPAAIVIAMLINLVVAMFWVRAAAVKYRRPDLPALNAWRGVLFLALWLVIATGGIVAFDRITRADVRGMHDHDLISGQWIGTMILSLAIAAVVMACTAECQCLIGRGRSGRSRWDGMSDWPIGVVCVALICGLMAVVGWDIWRPLLTGAAGEAGAGVLVPRAAKAWSASLAALALGIITARSAFLLAFDGLRIKGAWLVSGFILAVLWAVPPIADAFRIHAVAEFYGPQDYSAFFGCSPAGTIVIVWGGFEAPVIGGLIVQAITAAALWLLAGQARRWGRQGADSDPFQGRAE